MEIELAGGVVGGVISLVLVTVLFIRHKKRRAAKSKTISDWKQQLSAVDFKLPPDLPVSVTSVPTQMALSNKQKNTLTLPLLELGNKNVECEKDRHFNYRKISAVKDEVCLIDPALYREELTDSSTEDVVQHAEEVEVGAEDKTPDSLPEVWSTPTYATTIRFTLTYVDASNVLAVDVLSLINLPKWKPFKSSSSHRIKFKLVPNTLDRISPTSLSPPHKKLSIYSMKRWHSHSSVAQMTTAQHQDGKKSIKKPFDAENGTFFAFSGYTRDELKNCCFNIYLYEMKYKQLREKLIGECSCPLAQFELEPGTTVTCLQEVKLKKHDSSKEKTSKCQGQLLLSLYYQSEANRMKVLIRKATDLPKKLTSTFGSDFSVQVNVIYGGQVMHSQETKTVSSRSSPVWNQPLIFDLPRNRLEKYSLQFITSYSDSFSKTHHIIGHVVVGPDISGKGRDHWLEATRAKSVESTMWHNIQIMQ